MSSKKVHLRQSHKASSQRWLSRHLNDYYVHQARKEGYRCRAAFKLAEIDQRFKIFQSGLRVLDLGACPGGWSQVAQEKVGPKGRVIAIDLLPMAPLEGVDFFQGDILSESIKAHLFGLSFHVILSDMAPSLTGHSTTDRLKMEALLEQVTEVLDLHGAMGGTLVAKIFPGLMVDQWAPRFKSFRLFKPSASRTDSREIYVIAQGLK